jgi:hypothetical protein
MMRFTSPFDRLSAVQREGMLISRCLALGLLALLLTLTVRPSHAATSSYDVFVNSTLNKDGAGLYFVDARTGLSTVVSTGGSRHTLLDSGVLYQEDDSGTIMVAYPDGRKAAYPAIQPPDPKATVNWVISPDRKRIAWAVSQLSETTLLSDLFVADIDGGGKKLALHTSSTKNIDTIPLALTNDGGTVFYSRQSSVPRNYQLFPVAGDVFRLDVASGQATQLPDNAKCACAVGFTADGARFERLEATAQGFAARLWDLAAKIDTPIGAPGISHTQAGYLVLSRDGNMAMYTSARGVPPAKGVPPERYALILIDVARREQRLMTPALVNKLRAVTFAPDNSAVLVVGADKDGTFKLSLQDGTLLQVSPYTFLGTITD